MISDFRFYMKLLSRRLPAMVVLFLIASIAGVVIAQRLPTMYQSAAKLLVESAQINFRDNSDPDVTAAEQLEVIQQRLLTRANLLEVASDNRVFPNAASMTPDEIVQEMRQRTKVRRATGRNRATLMTISFQAERPRVVAAVVNQYVSIVLETNSEFRNERTEGTLSFFEREVKTLSENLDLQNAKIVAFKRENADALPDNLGYRLNRQSLLQERQGRAERDLEALEAQIESVKRIFEETGSLTAATGKPLTPQERDLKRLEGELQTALSIYSEQNPKIRLLRARINTLQSQVEQAAELAAAEAAGNEADVSALDVSLAELSARQTALKQEITDTAEEARTLAESIDRTPANGITLNAMERDRANIQRLYTNAVQRLSAAQLEERVELSAKGERITVLEPAAVPNKPFSPNRPKVAATGVGAGLGLAAALFIFLELINQAIRRPADIVRSLDITPLATVPRIETAAHRRWRRGMQLASLIIVLVGVPGLLWAVDTYYMPLDLLFEKIIDRLV